MKYIVHFSGYYGYDALIEADSFEEALEAGQIDFDNSDANDWDFESENAEVIEEEW